ncbi:putative rhodanese [Magnetofaba australis IT-1]|uniref:TVP38/TMEM64 family membrane protein n=2 Tax=Magnetofaba TaxID=1472292 RepID=A0A1Y2K3Z2_9PROT|nr:putative rhodanese [Magnetofaba australis IT-1]
MRQTHLKRIGLIGLLALVGIGLWQGRSLDPQQLMQWIDGLGPLAWLAFIVLYAVATVAFLPGSLLTLAGGALFGPVLGTFVNLTGATLGAVLAFLAARYLGADWVRARAGARLGAILDGVEAEGWRFVAFVRLTPLFPFNLLNYALGLTRISLLPYLLATWICMLPGAIAYTWLGYVGREAAAGGEDLIRKGLLAMGLLVAVAFLPRLVKRWKEGQGPHWSIDDLHRRREEGETMTLLDVRDAKDFNGKLGHIPGSLNIPLPELAARLEELRADGHALAVVCNTDKRSAKAVQQLQRAGLDNAILVIGGVQAWKGRGWPLEQR